MTAGKANSNILPAAAGLRCYHFGYRGLIVSLNPVHRRADHHWQPVTWAELSAEYSVLFPSTGWII